MTGKSKPNRLINETSPYLLQHAHNSLLTVLGEFLSPTETVIIRGDDLSIFEWNKVLSQVFAPRRLLLGIPDGIPDLPGALVNYLPKDGKILAYVCQDGACLPLLSEMDRLKKVLRAE